MSSERLKQMMSEIVTKEGELGKARLANRIKRGSQMIERYIRGTATPSRTNAFELALECGSTEAEALVLADEVHPHGQGDPPEAA